jgi:hypothetical protein
MAQGRPGSGDPHARGEIKLSTPWGGPQLANVITFDGDGVVLDTFIQERTRVHEAYIREQAKSKRLGLALAAGLILSATLILVFAPPGREQLSYWIGAALLVFAAGAAGYKRVWGRSAVFSVGADSSDAPVSDQA